MQLHPKQLLSYIKEQKREFIDLLEQIVEIETPTGHRSQQNKLLDLIESQLLDIGFYTERLSGTGLGGQLYARPRHRSQDAPFQLLTGYTDTRWPLQTLPNIPFKLNQQYIRGPGVYQMKAGLAMLLTALKAQQRFGLTPKLTPVIFIYSDEKMEMPESRPTLKRLSRYADRALILEPSLEKEGKIITSSKGKGRFRIKIKDKTAPTGLKPNEDNGSVLKLSHVVQQLYDLNDPQRDLRVEISEFDGGVRSNVLTGDQRATVDISLAHTEDIYKIENVVHNIKSATSTVNLSVRGSIQRPPMPHNKRNHALWVQISRIAEALEIDVSNGISQKASVGTLTSRNTATVSGLGPVGFGDEAEGEAIDLDKTLERCALLCLLMAGDGKGS